MSSDAATQVPPIEPAEREMALLKAFTQRPGCDAYTTASKRIELLTTFIWLRQLTDELTFERFLDRFAAVADYNAENRKHPSDALNFYCPRTKKSAEALGREQWTAAEVADVLVLYVELLGIADSAHVAQDEIATLAQFLRTDGVDFKEGRLQPPKAPVQKTKRRTSSGTPAPVDADSGISPTGREQQPSQTGQRVVYHVPNQNRQVRGRIEQIIVDSDRRYVDFMSDEGERFQGQSIDHFAVMEEEDDAGNTEQVVELERKRLTIAKAIYPKIQQALAMDAPMGNVKLGDIVYGFNTELDTAGFNGCKLGIDVNVINGETGPYVEAELVNLTSDETIDQLIPRQSILGEYRFSVQGGMLVLEVCARE